MLKTLSLWTDSLFHNAALEAHASSKVVQLKGVSDSKLLSEFVQLREVGQKLGFAVFLLDPHSANAAEQTVDGFVHAYLEMAERRGHFDESVLELVQRYSTLTRTRITSNTEVPLGHVKQETLGQLLTEVSLRLPLCVVACHMDQARPSDREMLSYLSRYVFNDPILRLNPELASHAQARGMLLFAEPLEGIEFNQILDLTAQAEASVRAYLSEDNVVDRIVNAVRGDVHKLSDLVDQLSVQNNSLQFLRVARLNKEARRTLEVLALAQIAIAADVLQSTLEILGEDIPLAMVLRELTEQRWIRRTMGAGEIKISIPDSDLQIALAESINERDALPIHGALAAAELRTSGSAHSAEFVARQYLAAGEFDLALQFGKPALHQLASRGAWEEVLNLFDTLKIHDDQELRVMRMEAHAALGQYQDALAVGLALLDDLEESDQRNEHTLRVCQFLVRQGLFDDALSRFQEVLKHSPSKREEVDARLGQAEARYALGEHSLVVHELEAVLQELEATPCELSRTVVARQKLNARNTLGKIAIFQARYDVAQQCFETNRDAAIHFGWDDERARALANLGVVALQRRDHQTATRFLSEALEASSTQGSLPKAYCHVNLATIAQREEDYTSALDHCLEGMRCARRAGDQTAYGIAAHNLATIYQDLGHFDRAHEVIDHLRDTRGHERSLAGRWNTRVRAYLHLDANELEKAQTIFTELLSAGSQDAIYGPESTLRLAQVLFELDEPLRAQEILDAFDMDTKNGDRDVLKALIDILRADIALSNGDYCEAEKQAADAQSSCENLSQRSDAIRAALIRAKALEASGQNPRALRVLSNQLENVQRRATTIPSMLRAAFFQKPIHQRLVKAVQQLRGEVPSEFIPSVASVPQSAPRIQERPKHWSPRFDAMIGNTPKLHQIFRVIDRVADSDATVLIYGESGTGKELIAESLHHSSERAKKPFIKVNCAAFVENLLLSELFGHEKGAFTGANQQKAGRFELANGGTLFLDEIGDISPNTQVALLRVLQEGTFERVGGNETLHVNVRVVCATNKNLEEMVQRGEFRLDLYYRLKGVVVESPALRERREDIPALVKHFTSLFDKSGSRRFSTEVLEFLARYSWPGNIRELQNFIKSILLFVEGDVVQLSDLEDFNDFFVSGSFIDHFHLELEAETTQEEVAPTIAFPTRESSSGVIDAEDILISRIVHEGLSLNELKHRLEVESIKRALVEADGNVTRAAELLQMKRPRLSQIINGTEELAHLKANLVG